MRNEEDDAAADSCQERTAQDEWAIAGPQKATFADQKMGGRHEPGRRQRAHIIEGHLLHPPPHPQPQYHPQHSTQETRSLKQAQPSAVGNLDPMGQIVEVHRPVQHDRHKKERSRAHQQEKRPILHDRTKAADHVSPRGNGGRHASSQIGAPGEGPPGGHQCADGHAEPKRESHGHISVIIEFRIYPGRGLRKEEHER